MGNLISICTKDDIDDLVSFFDHHWAPNHVFSRRRDVLDWQHRGEDKYHYDFVISRSGVGAINGILGFIPTDRFSPTLRGEKNTIWQTTWMVLRSDETKGLGVQMLKYILNNRAHGWTGTCGLNHGTRKIYDKMGYITGEIHQWYMFNPDFQSSTLAVSPNHIPYVSVSMGADFQLIKAVDFLSATEGYDLDQHDAVPYKSRAQFNARYALHPYYNYRFCLLKMARHSAVLVTRLCTHEGSTALRIVDFLGDPAALASGGHAIIEMLRGAGAEYADFYCSGLANELEAAGMRRVVDVNGLIVPSHFEPFQQKSVALLYALNGPGKNIVICKGDGDQDRPNLLEAQS